MIFVTTGTQEPFNRLLKAMDEIANEIGEPVIAQASGLDFEVKHMKVVNFLEPGEFEQLFSSARLIISHAGTGSIISALTTEQKIIIVPRYAKFGEHRNDHQYDTAKKLEGMLSIPVIYEVANLSAKIKEVLIQAKPTGIKLGLTAPDPLIGSLKKYIFND